MIIQDTFSSEGALVCCPSGQYAPTGTSNCTAGLNIMQFVYFPFNGNDSLLFSARPK